MRIALAADHAGYVLKDELVRWLSGNGHEVEDLGTNGPESVDYPEFGSKLARVVGSGGATKEQVQFMLTRLLRLKAVPAPSDAADGVAAALTYLMTARLPKIGASAPVAPSVFAPKPPVIGNRR